MAVFLPAAVFVTLLWWGSTGVLMSLCSRDHARPGRIFAALSLLLPLPLGVIAATARVPTEAASYLAFAASLTLWGWIEAGFLLGILTGPSRAPCPEGAGAWLRFIMAARATAWQHAAILGGVVVIWAITGDGANPTALAAFALLAIMRMSAQLNLFLGVRHITLAFMPRRLTYLATYFRMGRNAAWLPISIFLLIIAASLLTHRLLHLDGHMQAGCALLLSLLLLGIAEHAFLLAPLGDERLWRWAQPAATAAIPATLPLPPASSRSAGLGRQAQG